VARQCIISTERGINDYGQTIQYLYIAPTSIHHLFPGCIQAVINVLDERLVCYGCYSGGLVGVSFRTSGYYKFMENHNIL
jgi:hypothetical protein